MASEKKQQQTNTFGFQAPPDTQDTKTLRAWQPQTDPTIPYTFGRARQELQQTHQNPYGAYESPAVRDAGLRTGEMDLAQQQAQANRASQYDVNNQSLNKETALAGLTKNNLVQTGGTTTNSGGFLGDLLLATAGGGSAGAAA